MKKLLIYITLLCLIISSFSACSSTGISNENNADKSNVNTEGSVDNIQFGERSRTLTFYPAKELTELKDMLDKSEEEIKEFLDKNSIDYNTIHSKKDAISFFEKTGNLKTLHVKEESGWNLVSIIYYMDYGYILSIYERGEEMIHVTSYIKGESPFLSEDGSAKNEYKILSEKLIISDTPVDIYDYNGTDAYEVGGNLETSNSVIGILFISKEASTYKAIEKDIIVTTINEMLEQNQIK